MTLLLTAPLKCAESDEQVACLRVMIRSLAYLARAYLVRDE
jgi:hypothetical protein